MPNHTLGGVLTARTIPPKPWAIHAACADVNPDLFFPQLGEGNSTANQAKKICADCPVQTQCLNYALDNDERFGIWGGTTRRERQAIKRFRRWPAA